METTSGLPPAEVRLKRFLHYGSEAPLCVPGDRFFLNCFLVEKLSAVEDMLANCTPDKQGEAVNHILKAFMDGYSGYSECLVFALAVCTSQKSSELLRAQAYKAVKKVCKTSRDIFLFTTFSKKLSAPTSGWGSGCRKALCEWYVSKEPLELAACVTQFRGAYGMTHRDIFKLCHPKPKSKAQEVIISYVMKGLEASKLLHNEDPTVQKVLSYLQVVEDVKHLADVQACAGLIESHKLSKEYVICNQFKSPEIWLALVPNMSLQELLECLPRMSCDGLLKSGQPLVASIIDRLLDQTAIVESHLHPTEVYCATKFYENHAKNKRELMEKLLKQGKIEKTLKPAPKPNSDLLVALNKLLISTLKLLVPTGMRYMVAIDLTHNMKQWKCNGSRDVKPAQAAILLALCLLQAEREVTVVTFPALPGAPPEEGLTNPVDAINQAVSQRGKKKSGDIMYSRKTELKPMTPLTLNKELSVTENLENLSSTNCGSVEVCQPIVWAQQNKMSIDVFIVMTDYVTLRKRKFLEPAAALQEYREQMNLSNSKLITCALASNTLDVAASNDVGMLDIVGFNGKVARIIEAFSRGAF